jgi:tape measure domain-containing protein
MAQLELSVVLNLANFRTQLGKLAQASAAYYYPINLTIDQRAFKRQLTALGQIKTTLQIKDGQIDGARKRIGVLNKSLATLRRATATPIIIETRYKATGDVPAARTQAKKAVATAVKGQDLVDTASYEELQKLYKFARAAGLQFEQLKRGAASSTSDLKRVLGPAFRNIGSDVLAGIKTGLANADSQLAKVAQEMGSTLISKTKNTLGIKSPSRVFKEIGQDIVDGLELGLEDFNSLRTKMVGKMREFISAVKREAKVGGIALGGLLSPIARPSGAATRTIPGIASPTRASASTDPGRGNQRILNSLSLLTGNPALYRGRMANLGTGRLPSSLLGAAQSQFNLEELAPSFKQARLASGTSPLDKIIDEAFFGRGTLPKAQSALSTLNNSLERLGNAARAALPSGILQSASGNPRMRAFGGVAPGQSMGLFQPTARPTAYPPSGGFLEFSRRATAISAGLPGNVFGGRGGGGGRPPGGPSGGFPSDGMHIPSTQLGAGYYAVGKGLKGIQSAYGQVSKFLDTKKFPVTGAISEIGGEFGNAIKQVLLFGTAYKALAFLTSLPGQAFEAAKGLATYKNQLEAVTKESGTFEQSFAFVDNLATRFNVPLNSARQGFAKLYASMKPAGFDQGQIEGLFTGISKAAAAFGLSSDKVDRVNYAFAQMASKGQIMSEELKGQLGDVLPGALGLFAKAAQMSIPEFSKAMEDGAFKGKAMEQVLGNVAILLDTQFGSAAEGASKTLQGAVNQIQNNLQLMYESFGPIVNAAAAAFGPQINSLIKDVTDTMKVLTGTFTQAGEGFETLSPRAQAFYSAIQTLRPSLEQAGVALADLGGKLASLLPLFVQVISAAISFASSPLGRGAIIAATAIGVLTGALKLLEVTGLKAALKAVYAFIGGLLKIPAATGAARLGVISLKLALTGVFVGAIFLGLDLLIGKLLNIGDAANDSKDDIRGMRKELDAMAGAGDIESTSKAYLDANTKLAAARKANQKALSDLRAAKARPEGDTQADISKGVTVANAQTKANETYAKVLEAQKDLQAARRSRASAVAVQEQQDQSTKQALQKIDLSGEEQANKKKTSLESYYSLQDQLAKAQTQADLDRLEAAFEHARAMVNAEYDLREARANSFQKKAIAFQKEIFAIISEQDAALLKNRSKVLAAAGSVEGGAGGGGGGGKNLGAGIAQYITGDPSSPFYKADHGGGNYHEHLAFVSREAAEEAYKKLTSAGVQVTEFKGKSRVGRHTPGSAHYEGLAFDVPGAQVPVGRERELTARVQSILGIGGGGQAGAPRVVKGNERRDELAQQQVSLATREMNAAAIEKEAESTLKLQIATENYVQSLVPTSEQALQNQLLAQRITLTRDSFSPEILEAQLALAEQELQVAENIRINTDEINKLTAASGNNVKQINALKDANAGLKASLPVSAIQLLAETINKERLALVERTRATLRDAETQDKVSDLIIGGMSRQAAEAKVTADNLRNNYRKALEEATRQVDIAAAAEEAFAITKRMNKVLTAEQTAEYERLAQALRDAKRARDELEGKAPGVESDANAAENAVAPKTAKSYMADGLADAQENLEKLTNTGYQVVQAANAIGDAFGNAFKGVINGSMTVREALAGFFQSVADHFADMVAQMIAEWLKAQIIKGFMNIFSMLIPGGGGAMGDSAKFGLNTPDMEQYSPLGELGITGFATGGIAPGGFRAFANGGMVTGPTMGLVGEGRYNEAIVPLPDGKSIPVELGGASQGNVNVVVNVDAKGSQVEGNEAQSKQLGRVVSAAVQAEIVKQQRPGGLLSSSRSF